MMLTKMLQLLILRYEKVFKPSIHLIISYRRVFFYKCPGHRYLTDLKKKSQIINDDRAIMQISGVSQSNILSFRIGST